MQQCTVQTGDSDVSFSPFSSKDEDSPIVLNRGHPIWWREKRFQFLKTTKGEKKRTHKKKWWSDSDSRKQKPFAESRFFFACFCGS